MDDGPAPGEQQAVEADQPDPPPARGRVRAAALVTGRTLVALLSAAALAGAGLAWATLDRTRQPANTTNVLSDLATAPNSPPTDDGATDILLIGSDSRTDLAGNPLPVSVLKQLRTEADSGLNTDTIILLRVPRSGGRTHAISIPRDTFVPIPGYREDKINAAYGMAKLQAEQQLRAQGVTDPARIARESDQAGRRALVQTVQDLTGLRVDHYAEVGLYGFYLLSEALGGVDVCLRHATTDPESGANFRAGVQQISGADALSFVRQRVNLPRGDLDRIVRQQAFLGSAVRKLFSGGVLADPGKLGDLMDAVKRSVVVDAGWNVVSLLGQVQSLASGKVDFVTIPVTNTNARNDRGQSIVTVDRDQVRAFVAGLVGSAPAPAAPAAPPAPASPAAPPTPPVPGSPGNPPGGGQRVAGSPPLRLDGGVPDRPQPRPANAAAADVPCVD
ncbi:LCP family protein [Gandjariella thermophila]|uniref:LytTR family transcriptional regulator n=1 Tax=Gandjariella thermophila TaxID=1931992 RepID=A0A4D4J3S9_9PSEU|nr:LCP family protein [Gandjariella thermophila]GDY31335.1 LytTR family transcriptional regulator [Gandjariella thermophila]